MFTKKRMRRKVYVGFRPILAVAAIAYFGGIDEFASLFRELGKGVVAVETVHQAQINRPIEDGK